jgi:MFS family permease
VIGGAIATGFGWRGTFVFLVIVAVLLFILIAIMVHPPITPTYPQKVPETLPYIYYEKHLTQKFPNKPNPFPKPVFLMPWKPLEFFKMPSLIVITLASGFSFLALYILLIILPLEVTIFGNNS